VAIMKSTIFWDITSRIPLKVTACHLLSAWHLARLILRPSRWRLCSSEKSVDFQWTTRRYIPKDCNTSISLAVLLYFKMLDLFCYLQLIYSLFQFRVFEPSRTFLKVNTLFDTFHFFQTMTSPVSLIVFASLTP
jgi:hypothetical protein